ncbi:pyridoxal-phosphate dependent enzyme, partial [bacterium]
DRVVVPMGTGGNLSMIWKSIKELCEVGLIKSAGSMMTGVQAEGCDPIVEAFKSRRQFIRSAAKPRTIALDIAVKSPMYGSAALRAIRESRGSAIAVSDAEILEATRQLAKTEGIFAEPAAASTLAGLKKLIDAGNIERSEEIVCVITGAGLKDPGTARKIVERLKEVDALLRRTEERRLTTKLGDTKTRILEILSSRQLHGYGIWKELKEAFGLEISIPSVYEHLAELEMLKLIRRIRIEAVAGRRVRQYYSLTDVGRDAVRAVSKLAAT